MSLRERGAQVHTAPKEPCIVGAVRLRLDDDDRAFLEEALADVDTWTAPKLMVLLRDEGHTLSASAIRVHRRGECRCGTR